MHTCYALTFSEVVWMLKRQSPEICLLFDAKCRCEKKKAQSFPLLSVTSQANKQTNTEWHFKRKILGGSGKGTILREPVSVNPDPKVHSCEFRSLASCILYGSPREWCLLSWEESLWDFSALHFPQCMSPGRGEFPQSEPCGFSYLVICKNLLLWGQWHLYNSTAKATLHWLNWLNGYEQHVQTPPQKPCYTG